MGIRTYISLVVNCCSPSKRGIVSSQNSWERVPRMVFNARVWPEGIRPFRVRCNMCSFSCVERIGLFTLRRDAFCIVVLLVSLIRIHLLRLLPLLPRCIGGNRCICTYVF